MEQMEQMEQMEHEDTRAARQIVDQIAALDPMADGERRELKERLLALATGPAGAQVRNALEAAMKGLLLETRWELEDVLEEATPKKPAPPKAKDDEPKEEPPPEGGERLSAADLVLLYDDPRGLMLHRTKTGDRWFATQADPRTGQPVTFEVPPDQLEAVKEQLKGSPYWVLGSDSQTP